MWKDGQNQIPNISFSSWRNLFCKLLQKKRTKQHATAKATVHQQINEQTKQEMHFLTNLMESGKRDYKNTKLHYCSSHNAVKSVVTWTQYFQEPVSCLPVFFFSAWELWSNVWIWFTNCTGPPSAPGRREQGESSVCRNDYLRFLILKLKVRRAFAPRTTVHQDILREIPFSMGMRVNSQSTQDSLGRKWRHE